MLKLVALHTVDCRSHDHSRENGRYAYGQDDHDISVVRGGPNGAQSLDQARADYANARRRDTPVSPAANPNPDR